MIGSEPQPHIASLGELVRGNHHGASCFGNRGDAIGKSGKAVASECKGESPGAEGLHL